ncbi:phenylalanine--tRNA ligase beta subunit-like isoform X2 [Oppia nitens]|uniref:phenylalanine--tRNA ligase beta subunit-like isoform X2 n=1 Tax=Oppia nitens TaxID=1686743 RepID=UPI0023D9EDCD|nr:phenylalanine--tRNA ligase beta subunit-like isoform X2 [Oppia nitens]
MPTININRDLLFQRLGQVFTEDEFNDLCFDFGIELDEVTSEKQIKAKEQGTDRAKGASEDVIYRIEIPANRYDLLCVEGLTRALLIFLGKSEIPEYRSVRPSKGELQQLIVLPNVRPFAVAAILRGVKFNQQIYDSFIDLQEKLHQNLCRKRTLVAIGAHDLDKLKGPFYYDARVPNDIKFKPLKQTKEYTATQLMDLYQTDDHLRPFLHIIRDSPVYPVIYDQNNVILSMPPIINGDYSKITLNTENIFIEMTATDLNKAKLCLDTFVSMFSEYCEPKFTVESVEVTHSDTSRTVYPVLNYREETITVDYVNSHLGIKQTREQIAVLLNRMSLGAELLDDQRLKVRIPPIRQDILHACDILEDAGIAYGYNNIEFTIPKAQTIGHQYFPNKVSDQLRNEIARCGYTEVLTFSLCSRDDIADKMRRKDALAKAVHIANPKTLDFQVARTSLLPGLLKTLYSNKKVALPLKIFEVSDIVLKDNNQEVGARNERYLAAVYYNKTPGFEVIHGLMDRILHVLEIRFNPLKTGDGYFIRSANDSRFLSGRCAEVVVNNKVVGIMGVLHPEVITNFDLVQPCSALELSLESLIKMDY